MALQSIQQLTGANYFFYYGATIFQSVGIKDNFVTQTILGIVCFVSTSGGIYVMERVSWVLYMAFVSENFHIVWTKSTSDIRRYLAVDMVICLRNRWNCQRSYYESGYWIWCVVILPLLQTISLTDISCVFLQ